MRKPEPQEILNRTTQTAPEVKKMHDEVEAAHKGLFKFGDEVVFLNRKQRRELHKKRVAAAKKKDRQNR